MVGKVDDNGSGKARTTRFHGRVSGTDRDCEHPGCAEEGEFRAPRNTGAAGEGAARWRWLCLEHVRAFNAGYNYFEGMSPAEIEAAQTVYAGWERETRAFATHGAGVDPAWGRFTDPADLLKARFAGFGADQVARAANGRALSPEDRGALRALGLSSDVRLSDIRRRYTELVRSYHPDRNGGDRSKEAKLQDVIAAYTHLKRAPAFA